MDKKRGWTKKLEDKLYDHPILQEGIKDAWAVLVLIFSAFVFAFGYKCFLNPTALVSGENPTAVRLISGGVSGISQTISMIIQLFPGNFIEANPASEATLYSILYFAINIPIFLVAWFGIGKRFAIFTIINVACVSGFTTLLGVWDESWIKEIASFVNENGGMLSRAIFAGVCTGISSGLAFKVDGSGGGIDVISYFIALKKGVLVGKYGLVLNFFTMTAFVIAGSAKVWWFGGHAVNDMQYIVCAFFALVYLLTMSSIIDLINLRNKKIKIQVVTANPELAKIIIGNIPHGATVLKGHGAYSGSEREVILLVVSSYEMKNAVKLIQEADPNAFVEVSELKHVYGRFFLPPIK